MSGWLSWPLKLVLKTTPTSDEQSVDDGVSGPNLQVMNLEEHPATVELMHMNGVEPDDRGHWVIRDVLRVLNDREERSQKHMDSLADTQDKTMKELRHLVHKSFLLAQSNKRNDEKGKELVESRRQTIRAMVELRNVHDSSTEAAERLDVLEGERLEATLRMTGDGPGSTNAALEEHPETVSESQKAIRALKSELKASKTSATRHELEVFKLKKALRATKRESCEMEEQLQMQTVEQKAELHSREATITRLEANHERAQGMIARQHDMIKELEAELDDLHTQLKSRMAISCQQETRAEQQQTLIDISKSDADDQIRELQDYNEDLSKQVRDLEVDRDQLAENLLAKEGETREAEADAFRNDQLRMWAEHDRDKAQKACNEAIQLAGTRRAELDAVKKENLERAETVLAEESDDERVQRLEKENAELRAENAEIRSDRAEAVLWATRIKHFMGNAVAAVGFGLPKYCGKFEAE